jgi:hypothetical protein
MVNAIVFISDVKNNKLCKYIWSILYKELITQQSLIEDADTTEE